jgi:hypothetical protein
MAPYLNTVGSFDPLAMFMDSMGFFPHVAMSECVPNHLYKYRKSYTTIAVQIHINIQTRVLSIQEYKSWILHEYNTYFKDRRHLIDIVFIYDRLFSQLESNNPLPF